MQINLKLFRTYLKSKKCSEQRPFVCKAEYFDFTPSWSNFIDAAGQKYDCPMGWSGEYCEPFQDKV